MREKIILVDDFYKDPDAVRRVALGSGYVSAAKYNYPGFSSHSAFKTEALVKAFERILGRRIEVDPDRFTFGGFRLMTEQTGTRPKVHADTVVDWAAMVYLTPDAPVEAGTGFYRHRATGLWGPPTDKEARALGYEDANEFERQVARRDTAHLEAWELVGQVAPLYNRLLLFRGTECYHAALAGCGKDVRDGRLTHNFFFDEAPE